MVVPARSGARVGYRQVYGPDFREEIRAFLCARFAFLWVARIETIKKSPAWKPGSRMKLLTLSVLW